MMAELDRQRIPKHVAVIMDGNGRWAKAKGLPRTAGHIEGVEAVRRVTEACVDLGVKYLTLYTFSTENWNRPAEEVKALMGLLFKNLEDEIFMKNNVRFRVIGDTGRLPAEVQEKMQKMINHTAQNDAMTMVLAISYSARWEITRAMQEMAREGLAPADITEEVVGQHMQTAFMPDPDLLIRTGGEQRISNYLLWQIAYSELYFTDTYWPDFGAAQLEEAISAYQARERRYGKTSEQVSQNLSPQEQA
ncbi:MAG: isoprenyl transferase [Bacteroidales bacterium]|nr:isoprenyl transferase [Bacteroidales bacterium]